MTALSSAATIAKIVSACRKAALAGEREPTNGALATLIGVKSPSTATDWLTMAEKAGHIVIRRGNCSRVIAAADGSWCTAGDVKDAHWRDRDSTQRRSRAPKTRRAENGHVRRFTEAEDELLRRFFAREISYAEVIRALKAGPDTLYRRMTELGLPHGYKSRGSQTTHPRPSDGWVPIAFGFQGKWRLYEGSPITIDAARAAVDAGKATMAQKRIDGGYDLLFRALA